MHKTYKIIKKEENGKSFLIKSNTLVHIKIEHNEEYVENLVEISKNNTKIDDFSLEPYCIEILKMVSERHVHVSISYFDDLDNICILQHFVFVLNSIYDIKTYVNLDNGFQIIVGDNIILHTNLIQ